MSTLPTQERNALPARQFAFPAQRKEPLENASHVRNAVARFGQVQGVSDDERDAAWRRIEAAARLYGVVLHEALEPCGGAHQQDPERWRSIEGREIKGHERPVDRQGWRRLRVEHPLQVTMDEATELKCDVSPLFGERVNAHTQRSSCLVTREEERLNDGGDRRRRR